MRIVQTLQDKPLPRPFDARPATADLTQQRVPIGELLTASFVSRHSRFQDVDSLLSASGLNPCRLADLDFHTQRRWDEFIRLSTTFPNWAALLRDARGEWAMRRIGIVIDA